MSGRAAHEPARGREAFACYFFILAACLIAGAFIFATLSFPEAETGFVDYVFLVVPVVVIVFAIARLKGWTPQRKAGGFGGGAGGGGGGGGGGC